MEKYKVNRRGRCCQKRIGSTGGFFSDAVPLNVRKETPSLIVKSSADFSVATSLVIVPGRAFPVVL